MSEFPQLRAFLEAHVASPWRRIEAGDAVFPILTTLVKRNYEFRPLVDGDLEQLRGDLQTFLGMTIKEVRPVSIEGLLKRLPDESDEARKERFFEEIEAMDVAFADGLFHPFEDWSSWRVPEEVKDELFDAYADDLPDLTGEDPLRKEFLNDVLSAHYDLLQLAFLAAVADDDIVAQRVKSLVKWFSRCSLAGGLSDEPGVYLIFVK